MRKLGYSTNNHWSISHETTPLSVKTYVPADFTLSNSFNARGSNRRSPKNPMRWRFIEGTDRSIVKTRLRRIQHIRMQRLHTLIAVRERE